MRLRKALAAERAYLILAMAEALNCSTFVYIDIHKSKSDITLLRFIQQVILASRVTVVCALQLLVIFRYFKGLSVSVKKSNSKLRV